MLGTDKSRGHCLEMICADFLAGTNLDNAEPEQLLRSALHFFKFLCSFSKAQMMYCANEFSAATAGGVSRAVQRRISKCIISNIAAIRARIWQRISSHSAEDATGLFISWNPLPEEGYRGGAD
jgi:hypothetical protein